MHSSGKSMGHAIAAALDKPFHSLAHGLLAALPVNQVRESRDRERERKKRRRREEEEHT